jgi:hypothetical protein
LLCVPALRQLDQLEELENEIGLMLTRDPLMVLCGKGVTVGYLLLDLLSFGGVKIFCDFDDFGGGADCRSHYHRFAVIRGII